MEPNFYILFVAAIIPLAVGSLWYSPLMFNSVWMKAANMTEEKIQGSNMLIIFGLAYIFSVLLAAVLWGSVVHQQSVVQLFAADPNFGVEGSEIQIYFNDLMAKYGNLHRTFNHGAFHGAIVGVLFVTPVLAINAMFERKSWKYIAINAGYWTLTLILMGGVICAFI